MPDFRVRLEIVREGPDTCMGLREMRRVAAVVLIRVSSGGWVSLEVSAPRLKCCVIFMAVRVFKDFVHQPPRNAMILS